MLGAKKKAAIRWHGVPWDIKKKFLARIFAEFFASDNAIFSRLWAVSAGMRDKYPHLVFDSMLHSVEISGGTLGTQILQKC